MKYLIIAFWGLIVAVNAAHAQSNYRLQAGDILGIEVLEDPELNRNALILPDGRFTFPFAGSVRAAGRSVSQVQAQITAAISSNFASTPNVFVSVRSLKQEDLNRREPEPVTMKVYFLGEISNPGIRPVEPGTTFLQAMAQAGTLTKFAATKRVQLRRTNPETGQQTIRLINYRALSRGSALSRSIPLQEGDVILIPERRLFE